MSQGKSRPLHILTSEDHNYIYKLDGLKQMGAGLPADWASEEKKLGSSTAESHRVTCSSLAYGNSTRCS